MIRTGQAISGLSVLKEATSRDFRGGLDVADTELNLTSRYARALENVVIGIDGTLQVGQGSRLFADIAAYSEWNIVNYTYFANNLIVVNQIGEVFAVNGRGEVSVIWNESIANSRTPSKSKWGFTEYVHFDEFDGELIISNGLDKPLLVTSIPYVDYLADKGTGSNINVPISAISAKFNRHFVYAVGHNIEVSERDAAGTWTGDVGVQFAGIFDLSSYVTTGSTDIIGMVPFKNFLLVMFQECIVPVQFTEVTDPSNSLQFNVSPDSIVANYGSIAPRTIQDVGEKALALDIVGVQSVELASITKILSPDRPSRLIDPLIQEAIRSVDSQTLRDNAFALFDRRSSTYMLFIPNEERQYQELTKGFFFKEINNLKISAWSTATGNWACGARSSEGRIFLSRANDTQIFVMGDEVSDPIHARYVGEQETFDDGTTFTDETGFSPVADVNDSGLPIRWVWELPWGDFKHRGLSKTLRYIIMDTEGDQPFTVQAFVDDMRNTKDFGEPWDDDGLMWDDDLGWYPNNDDILTPALQYDLIARDAGGYGSTAYGNSPFGGGNNTVQRRLTLTPAKFNTLKLRFSGETMGPLKFVAITLLYQLGTIRRLP